MSRTIIAVITCALLCVNCQKRIVTISREHITKVINNTNKQICYLENGDGIKLIADSQETVQYSEIVSANNIFDNFAYSVGDLPPKVSVKTITLYNLHDTTSFYFTAKNGMYEEKSSNQSEEIFINNHKIMTESIDVHNDRLTFELTVTDAILGIMEKDYSMVENFPEYYTHK